jgi:hypothetical protein
MGCKVLLMGARVRSRFLILPVLLKQVEITAACGADRKTPTRPRKIKFSIFAHILIDYQCIVGVVGLKKPQKIPTSLGGFKTTACFWYALQSLNSFMVRKLPCVKKLPLH